VCTARNTVPCARYTVPGYEYRPIPRLQYCLFFTHALQWQSRSRGKPPTNYGNPPIAVHQQLLLVVQQFLVCLRSIPDTPTCKKSAKYEVGPSLLYAPSQICRRRSTRCRSCYRFKPPSLSTQPKPQQMRRALEVRALHDCIDRAGLLAEAAVDALRHVDVVACGSSAPVSALLRLDRDGLGGTDSLAQLARDAPTQPSAAPPPVRCGCRKPHGRIHLPTSYWNTPS
jgi:hypothetical protein